MKTLLTSRCINQLGAGQFSIEILRPNEYSEIVFAKQKRNAL
jgi:hypothetical protein